MGYKNIRKFEIRTAREIQKAHPSVIRSGSGDKKEQETRDFHARSFREVRESYKNGSVRSN